MSSKGMSMPTCNVQPEPNWGRLKNCDKAACDESSLKVKPWEV